MGYIARHRHGLGGLTDVASTAVNVIEDPCLSQVTKLVSDIRSIEARSTILGLPTGAPKPADATLKGIGLCKAVKPLELVVYIKRRPWIVPLVGISVIGGLIGLGYILGRK